MRYVDDMVLFDSSKRRLHKALEFIEAEVKATKQTVKDNWQVFILSKRPLDFLGFKFHPNKTTIRKSIMLRISRKARTIARAAYASIRNAHAMVSIHRIYREFRQPALLREVGAADLLILSI